MDNKQANKSLTKKIIIWMTILLLLALLITILDYNCVFGAKMEHDKELHLYLVHHPHLFVIKDIRSLERITDVKISYRNEIVGMLHESDPAFIARRRPVVNIRSCLNL